MKRFVSKLAESKEMLHVGKEVKDIHGELYKITHVSSNPNDMLRVSSHDMWDAQNQFNKIKKLSDIGDYYYGVCSDIDKEGNEGESHFFMIKYGNNVLGKY